MNEQTHKLYARFAAPSAEWRGKPFWSWNGELEENELCRQVEVLKEMGFGGHFMHSRSGLITKYLGEEWFRLINAVADKSKKEGMEAWLYDEDRWPSGSAGGKATVEKKYRIRSLRLTEYTPERYVLDENALSVFVGAVEENGIGLAAYEQAELTDKVSALAEKYGKKYGDQLRVLVFSVVTDPDSSNFNGSGYLNTMDASATERFIELTHEKYKENCKERFGSSVFGIFTDEPHRGNGLDDLREEDGKRTCSIAWTDDFFNEFQKRYGYNAEKILPEVFYRFKNAGLSRVKTDWFDLACNLFNERFAKPINDWCEKNGISFTGHVLHEDELINQTVANGSLMRFYENMTVPGVDTLGENYRYWIVKQLSSAARQTGKKRLLSELYGCTGWDFDFTGHRNVGNWQAFFGINLRCPHLSWYTMEGEAKRDYPASILHQSPWYKDYAAIETYFARFGLISAGESLCDTLVLNPIESVWGMAYAGWTNWLFSRDDGVNALEAHYEKLFYMLCGLHIDFDYGEEEMMSRLACAEVKNNIPVLRVGKALYKTVVVSGMLTMRETTLRLLEAFRALGGRVIFSGDIPACVNSEPSDKVRQLAQRCVCVPFEQPALENALLSDDSPRVLTASGENADKIYIRRFDHGGCFSVTLLNTDSEASSGEWEVRTGVSGSLAAEEWDLLTGERFGVPCTVKNGRVCFKTSLEAGGARAFVLCETDEKYPERPTEGKTVSTEALPDGEYEFSLEEENVCVLDRVVWRVNGGEWQPENEILRADGLIRDGFGIERRGGQMCQPWYAKLRSPETLGRVEMKYLFFADELPEGEVFLAGERPGTMRYKLNGVSLEPDGGFWTDICFKRMRVPEELIKKGVNEISVNVDFTRGVNFEALYLLGGFGVKKDGCYTRLTRLPQRLRFGSAAEQGLPFYGGNITYVIPAAVFKKARESAKKDGARIFLCPDGVQGSLVHFDSDAQSGKVYFRPYRCDITSSVKAGCDVRLTLVGNRRCTFGPMHRLPADHKGSSPGHFVSSGDEWSDEFAVPFTGIRKVTVEIEK